MFLAMQYLLTLLFTCFWNELNSDAVIFFLTEIDSKPTKHALGVEAFHPRMYDQ